MTKTTYWLGGQSGSLGQLHLEVPRSSWPRAGQCSPHRICDSVWDSTIYRQVCTQFLSCIAPPVLEHMYNLVYLPLGSRAGDALFVRRSEVQAWRVLRPLISHGKVIEFHTSFYPFGVYQDCILWVTGFYLERPERYSVTNNPKTQFLMTDGLRLMCLPPMSPCKISPPVCILDLETHHVLGI